MSRVLIGATVAASVVLPAAAQTVYRCGAEGRSYSQQACDEGRQVHVDDARSDAQQREAEQVAGRQARIARRLESERLATQPASLTVARIDGRGSAAVEPRTPDRSVAKKRRKSTPSDAGFSAAVPRPAKRKPTTGD